MSKISISYLRDCLAQDPHTGELRWKSRPVHHFSTARAAAIWNARFPGRVAGSIKGDGYLYLSLSGGTVSAHRAAWAIHYGEWPTHEIDHINRRRADNRIANLRVASRSDNAKNRGRAINNTSGASGVSRKGGNKWKAYVHQNGRQIHLGVFDIFEDAILARRNALAALGFAETHGELFA